MRNIGDVAIDRPIAVFGSGDSVSRMSPDTLAAVKSRCFVVMMNYAMCRFGPEDMDMLAFHDASVAAWLVDGHLKSGVMLWASEAAFPMVKPGSGGTWCRHPLYDALYVCVDCWFESSRGNCTLANVLHDVRTWRPGAKVLLFGVDMKGTGRWYNEAMGFKDMRPEDEGRYFEAMSRDLAEVRSGGKVWNCNLDSALDVFPKADWRKVVGA